MTTPPGSPPRERMIVVSNSPPRPQSNPTDALRCWLRNVGQIAAYSSQEDFESLSDLARVVPVNTLGSAEAQAVITAVQEVSDSRIFNPNLSAMVDLALRVLNPRN
jgi:hypothetical protein